jgi:hypothetical protein
LKVKPGLKLENTQLSQLGHARRVVAKDKTTISDRAGDAELSSAAYGSPRGAASGRGGLIVDARRLRDDAGGRRVVGLDCEGGVHVGDLPERGSLSATERSAGGGSSVAGGNTARKAAERCLSGGALREIASQEARLLRRDGCGGRVV